MTPEEAIQQLEFDRAMILFDSLTGEEITLEMLKLINKENYLTYVADGIAIEALKEAQQYREIGTVEECRKAVEKQKPEKPEIYTDTIQTISSSFNRDVYLCSRCGQFIGNIDDELPRYCNCCGQRIDEDLEGMENE